MCFRFVRKICCAKVYKAGFDLADYFIRRDEAFGWAMKEEEYPVFWDGNTQRLIGRKNNTILPTYQFGKSIFVIYFYPRIID